MCDVLVDRFASRFVVKLTSCAPLESEPPHTPKSSRTPGEKVKRSSGQHTITLVQRVRTGNHTNIEQLDPANFSKQPQRTRKRIAKNDTHPPKQHTDTGTHSPEAQQRPEGERTPLLQQVPSTAGSASGCALSHRPHALSWPEEQHVPEEERTGAGPLQHSLFTSRMEPA